MLAAASGPAATFRLRPENPACAPDSCSPWPQDEELDERTGEIPTDFGTIENLTAIAEDGAGELHLVDAGGEVFRLVPEPGAGASGAAAALDLAALRRRRAASGRRPGC